MTAQMSDLAPGQHALGGWLDQEVRDAMTPGVIAIPADASLPRVYDALIMHRVHAVLVVERLGGRPVGWISARGILRMAAAPATFRTAGQAVCEPAQTISPSATLRDAIAVMSDAGATHLLVAHGDDAMPEGVLSDLDLVRRAARR